MKINPVSLRILLLAPLVVCLTECVLMSGILLVVVAPRFKRVPLSIDLVYLWHVLATAAIQIIQVGLYCLLLARLLFPRLLLLLIGFGALGDAAPEVAVKNVSLFTFLRRKDLFPMLLR